MDGLGAGYLCGGAEEAEAAEEVEHRGSHLLSDPLQRHQDEAEVHCQSRAVAPCSLELRNIPRENEVATPASVKEVVREELGVLPRST